MLLKKHKLFLHLTRKLFSTSNNYNRIIDIKGNTHTPYTDTISFTP